METNYLPTKATCTGKDTVRLVSSPGIFHDGGKEIGTLYRAYFVSESGKTFFDDFNPAFWRELHEGTEVYFEKGTARILNN